MMKSHRFLKLVPAVAGLAALVLALGRCSPVSPSVYKNTLVNRSAPKGPAIQGEPLVHIFLYKTRVIDGDSLQNILSLSSGGKTWVTLSDNERSERFREFKRAGKTEFHLGDLIPEGGVAYLEVALPQSHMSLHDFSAFDTSLRPTGSGSWSLNISATTPIDLANLVLANLVSVRLSFTTDASIGTQSAPSDASPNLEREVQDDSQEDSETEPDPATQEEPAITGATGPTGPNR